jgi:hypothetical protein
VSVACMMSHCGSLRNIKHSLCESRQRSQQQCRPHSRRRRRAMAQVHADGLSAEEVGTGVKPHTRATWRSSKCTSTRFTRIAVFCGASEGASPVYMEAAQASLMLSCRHTLRWRIAVCAADQMTHDKDCEKLETCTSLRVCIGAERQGRWPGSMVCRRWGRSWRAAAWDWSMAADLWA